MNTSHVKAEVLVRGPARFDMVGRRLPSSLKATSEVMRPGTVRRLHMYALNRLEDSGFDDVVQAESFVVGQPSLKYWRVEVYTVNGDDPPSQRSYCVRFINRKGGYIEVVGILTRRGWPTLDHGLAIGELG